MPILEDGQLFERYRVHRWLGSGIAGESYEAEDRILQRKVTLKLIHPWSTLPDAARRQFFREMQGISLLNHPYLATVLDYGETDGRIYVARRYVSSGSLLSTNGRLWFHPPLPVTDAFTYAHQLAQTLQYIHQHGYLHGALTFANVLVLRGPNTEHDPDYAPFLVADVGLANFVRRFGQPRIETPPISIAPEQLNRRVAPASDQFALAVLLYFWLSGRPPYLGTPQEVEQQKLSEAITPLSILNPGITLEQDTIILRALTAYPEDRYPSVLAFTESLLASLRTPGRLAAPPLAPPPATPQVSQQATRDTTPPNTPLSAEQAPAPQTAQSALERLAEEIPVAAPPVPLQTEAYRSALEELLAHQQKDNSENVFEAEQPPLEEETKQEEFPGLPQEEVRSFPLLPETPPVGEIAEQIEFAALVSDEPTDQQNNRHTGPLVAEPPVDVLHAELDDVALQWPLELPEQGKLTIPDELPLVLKEPPVDPWLEELDEEEIPTVPHEELTRAIREFATVDDTAPASDEPQFSAEVTNPGVPADTSANQSQEELEARHALEDDASNDEINAPAISADISPLEEEANEEEANNAGVQTEFEVDEEGFVLFSPDEFASLHEMVSPVVFPDEPFSPFEGPATALTEETTTSHDELLTDAANQEDVPTIPPGEAIQELINIAELSPETGAEQNQDATSTAEQSIDEKALEEAPSAIPLRHSTADTLAENSGDSTTEEFSPVEESSLTDDDEDMPTEPQTSNPLVQEETELAVIPPQEEHVIDSPLPVEQPQEQEQLIDAELSTEQPREQLITQTSETLSAEVAELSPHISAPLQEAPETSSATYPPIDEAIIAPRLLISSPYTSSSYEFLLIGEETHIGRAGASDLYLEQDDLTSRHHALLKRAGERVLIFDKRSHNGVFLNGQKIEAGRGYELADGDHIGIGNYELIFRSAPAGHVSQLI